MNYVNEIKKLREEIDAYLNFIESTLDKGALFYAESEIKQLGRMCRELKSVLRKWDETREIIKGESNGGNEKDSL